MQSLYAKFSTDKDLEAGSGFRLSLGDAGWVDIRRAGGENLRFAKAYNKAMEPYAAEQEAGTLDEHQMRRVLAGVYAETIVMGWQVWDDDGEPIEFTEENVIKALVELNDFAIRVREGSQKLENFQRAKTKAAAKNSRGGSASKSASVRKRKA